jgi:hypothetical protein
MTEKYFISISPSISGNHTIHKQACPFLPDPGKRIPLGVFRSSPEAVKEGREYFERAESCPFCSKENAVTERGFIAVKQFNPDLISSTRMKKTSWVDLMFCSIS